MKNKLLVVVSLLMLFSLGVFGNENAENLAKLAISENPTESQNAVKSLREMKQAGLESLFEVYQKEIDAYKKTGQKPENWEKISNAIDAVAMQKDAYASKLFWHTNLEEAKSEAKKSGRAILSLRLLGNLNEEFSCANSRFFRSILYPNAEISKFLQDKYVLHWQTVRPAPKVTIDFGDGRKIERTLTGNSIHYVLDENGRVIDALTGLNSPQKFYRFLTQIELYAHWNENGLKVFDAKTQDENLTNFRAMQYRYLTTNINRIGNQLKLKFDTKKESSRQFEAMPPAMLIAPIAVTKRAVEINILEDITSDLTRFGEEQINLEQWKQIAKLSENQAKLDAESIAFIQRQTAKNNLTKAEFNKLIENLEGYISVDTARNEFLLRLSMLVWLNQGLDKDLTKLNEKVYAELFLTPNQDKWLGLYSTDIYTALDGNGIIQ